MPRNIYGPLDAVASVGSWIESAVPRPHADSRDGAHTGEQDSEGANPLLQACGFPLEQSGSESRRSRSRVSSDSWLCFSSRTT